MVNEQSPGQEELARRFQEYRQRIFNFALRLTGNRADAEDAAAEAFFALCRGQYAERPGAKFSTWLFTVTRNACLKRLRRKNRFLSLFAGSAEEGETDVPDDRPGSREEAERKETEGLVQKAIRLLPVSQREAILLREYEQMSYQEISGVLQCSLENVKILIFRARESLRKELEPVLRKEKS